MTKIPMSEQIAQRIMEHFQNEHGGKLLQSVLQDGMRKIVTEMVESEVTEFLGGRGHYERRDPESETEGYRNGYRDRRFQTGSGAINVPVPRVRNTPEPFKSSILDKLGTRTDQLENLVAEMYARGLSTRDIEDALRDESGNLMLSRSSVSRLAEVLWTEYEEFSERDLSDYDIEYLWLDAVYESMQRHLSRKEGIFAAWGLCRDGSKVLLALDVGIRESTAAWTEFIHGLVRRGLKEPLLVITDGNPGLLNAVGSCFPNSYRQRCIFHKMQNVLSKIPEEARLTIKTCLHGVYHAHSPEAGDLRAAEFIEEYSSLYPRAVKCFCEDLDACLTHLKFPETHRRVIRTGNLIERAFGEQKRRTKVIPRFFDEKSCLKLAYGSLIRASERFQRVKMNIRDIQTLEAMRRERGLAPEPTLDYKLGREVRKSA
jgi:putative transposase